MSDSPTQPSTLLDPGEIDKSISANPPAPRLGSIDAYRGLVMFLMMAESLHLRRVADKLPGPTTWKLLAHHQSHVEWVGCSLHDLIQPSFSFLVGVALPFSLANRLAKGQSKSWMTAHALWRSLILVFLGVFLRSVGRPQTYFTFEDTLSQIGLGYTFLFVLALFSAARPVCALWLSFWSATGQPSPSIRFPAAISILSPSVFIPIGRTIRPGSLPTGIRTATWPGPSIPGS